MPLAKRWHFVAAILIPLLLAVVAYFLARPRTPAEAPPNSSGATQGAAGWIVKARSQPRLHGIRVAQVSKPAVSPTSKSA